MDDDFDDYGVADDVALTRALEEAERRATQSKPSNHAGITRDITISGGAASGSGKADSAVSKTVQQPVPQKINRPTGSSIIVSTRQKGNPVLTYIKNVPWEYGDIVPDYVVGATACALFLSLKYHRLHPEYIYNRIKLLGHSYNLRILLVMVDIENHQPLLLELSKTCHINNLTLILSWTSAEAGRYLETYKSFEKAAPTLIQEKPKTDYTSRMVDVCTAVRSVSKKDAVTLVTTFGSVRAAMNAEKGELLLIQGWGEKKAERWEKAVREPFRVRKAKGQRLGEEEEYIHRREEGQNLEEGVRGRATRDVAGRLGIGPIILPDAKTQRQNIAIDDDDDEDAMLAEQERERGIRGEEPDRPESNGEGARSGGHERIMDALAKLRAAN